MNTTTHQYDLANLKSTPAQRDRRKIAREVAQMYDDIARATGLTPAERQTAWAISCRLWERDDQPGDQPRRVSLASIGSSLTKNSDNEGARILRAANRASRLFRHAIPRTGYQTLTRFKAEEDSGLAHEYVDHLMPVAAFFSELLAEEITKICRDRTLDRPGRGAAIATARQRIVAEALEYLPKCDAELLDPDRISYEFVSTPEAHAFCKLNPEYSFRPYEHVPPAEPGPPGPFCGEDLKRIEEKLIDFIDSTLDALLDRNSADEACLFAAELRQKVVKATTSWVKVATAPGELERRDRWREKAEAYTAGNDITKAVQFDEREEEGREIEGSPHVSQTRGVQENSDDLLPVENSRPVEVVPPLKTRGVPICNPLESQDLEKPDFSLMKNGPVENRPLVVVGSVNFDTSLEAAIFYARDRWHVIPICNFNPATGRCTAHWHKPDRDGNPCTGKTPLVKGTGKPGDGYTAATRDLAQIRKWWGREFPDAGVGMRMDGHIGIDCDVKDGAPGIESYEFLRDTFDLPETLAQITHSGGRHHVFKLPEGKPAEWLGSWNRVTRPVGLDGIDIKVGKRGLLFAEPTRGSRGFYRWVDPTAEIVTLPRECADFLHEIHCQQEKHDANSARSRRLVAPDSRAGLPLNIPGGLRDHDGRNDILFRKVACRARRFGASEAEILAQIEEANVRFCSDPLSDRELRKIAASAARYLPGAVSH